MNPLVINVAELLRKPGTERPIHVESTVSDLGIDEERLPGPVVVLDGRLDVLSDGVVVNGTVRATWAGECRRCLVPVGGPFEIPVQELYQVRVTDPDAFPLEHDQLDLRPMVREALLLDTPVAPLCRPDCAGICPVCGGDRNAVPCDCVTTPRDDRWAALDALREDSR
jgi:uncharacterized protein